MQIAESPSQFLRQSDVIYTNKASILATSSILLCYSSKPYNRIFAGFNWIEFQQFVSICLCHNLNISRITLAKVR